MEQHTIDLCRAFVSPEERSRLVWLCATISGDVDAAEDLAQETMLEAWRLEQTLRDENKRFQWLAGIARNICLRWLRKRGREMQRLVELPSHFEEELVSSEHALPGDFDIEVELERKELLQLLDRALALLPEQTRTVLIKRYVEESSLGDIAAQLQTNASAVAMRLQRGKLSLRRVLTTEMGQEIAPYTLITAEDAWDETPIWCYLCGQHRLLGKRDPTQGKLLLKCPQCSPGADEVISKNLLPALQGVKSYKPLYSRLLNWCDDYYRAGLRDGTIPCIQCGRPATTIISSIHALPDALLEKQDRPTCNLPAHERIICIFCPRCGGSSRTTLSSLVLGSSIARRFLQEHPRIRTLPGQHLEVDGRRAVLTSFESVSTAAKLIAISDYESYELLRVYEER